MTAADTLARKVADLERRLAAVERTPQLPASSIDDGALVVNDDTGAQVLSVGKQDDGTYAVASMNGGQVVASDVLDGIVTELALADDAVTAAKIAANAVTVTAIADGAITTPKLVAGSVQAGKIAAGAVQAGNIAAAGVTAGNLAANAVQAGNIAANAVTAGTLAAGAIAADRLQVGGATGNLIADPSFESAAMRAARLAGTAGATQAPTSGFAFDTGSALPRFNGSAFLVCSPDATTFKKMYLTPDIPTKAGEIFTGSFAVLASGSPAGTAVLNLRVTKQDASTSFMTIASVASASSASSWTAFSGLVTMPANAVSVAFSVEIDNHTAAGTWNIDAVEIRRVVAGVEIADGAITAAKISAGAINGQTIQSPNFVAGSAGFKLDGPTGALEANGATLRGIVQVGDPTTGALVQSTTIPAELAAKYGINVKFCIVQYASTTLYAYELTYKISSVTNLVRARGVVKGTTVYEIDSVSAPDDVPLPHTTKPVWAVGTDAPVNMTAGPYSPGAWVPTFVVQNLVTNFGAGGNPAVEDVQWAGTSLGRGVVLFEQIASVVSFPASTTPTVLYTTASIAWQPGRAYRVEHLGVYRAASLVRPALQLRKTNASGTVLVEGARPVIGTSANTDEPVSRIGYVVNDTAAVVNAPLALVFTQPATVVSGQLTGQTSASAPWIKVTDEGKALSAGGKITGVSV